MSDEPGELVLEDDGSPPMWLRRVPTRLAFGRDGLTLTLSRKLGARRQVHVPAPDLHCRLDAGAEHGGEVDLTLGFGRTSSRVQELRLRVAHLDLHVARRAAHRL